MSVYFDFAIPAFGRHITISFHGLTCYFAVTVLYLSVENGVAKLYDHILFADVSEIIVLVKYLTNGQRYWKWHECYHIITNSCIKVM
jgi:hypothetical protein